MHVFSVVILVPEKPVNLTVNSYKSVDSLVVNWTAPEGEVSYYIINITRDTNTSIQTNLTQVNFTGLSPGIIYNITVQAVSGDRRSDIVNAAEATCEYEQ